jgi:hypothetical protein
MGHRLLLRKASSDIPRRQEPHASAYSHLCRQYYENAARRVLTLSGSIPAKYLCSQPLRPHDTRLQLWPRDQMTHAAAWVRMRLPNRPLSGAWLAGERAHRDDDRTNRGSREPGTSLGLRGRESVWDWIAEPAHGRAVIVPRRHASGART